MTESDLRIDTPVFNRINSNVPTALLQLPTEIRLEIFAHLLNVNNIPLSFCYTPRDATSREQPTFRKHGLILASKQLSVEYRQAFYERTHFFLHIDSSNAFTRLPMLSSIRLPPLIPEPKTSTISSNFWSAPDKLLMSLRHCTLFVEIGNVASARESTHSVSQMVRANSSLPEARIVRSYMKTVTSLAAIKQQDAVFDTTFISAIEELTNFMGQLRSIQIVWDTSVTCTQRFSTSTNTNWSWRTLGQPFVDQLKERRSLQKLQVKVGDKYDDHSMKWIRDKECGEWMLADLVPLDIPPTKHDVLTNHFP